MEKMKLKERQHASTLNTALKDSRIGTFEIDKLINVERIAGL